MSGARLVYVGAVQDLGRVRVTYCPDLGEYVARLVGLDGRQVAEYFTDDRADAVATADAMMAEHARNIGRK